MSKSLLEKIIEEPAELLEEAVREGALLEKKILSKQPFRAAKEYWNNLGPGLTTGASDDDPSGIATYSQTGASTGFSLIWLSLFTFPLMAVVQEMCARIGLVTGRGLAANIRHHFPKWMLYITTILLVVANTFNIGANLGAMAKAVELLIPWLPFGVTIFLFALSSLVLQIFTTYARYAQYLKYLALVLFAYVFSVLFVDINWSLVIQRTIIPTLTFNKDTLLIVAAILGTTISPYLFFWQTSQEVEEEILEGKTTIAKRQHETSTEDIKNMRTDVWSGMFFSNFVMFFIIAACAATLHATGITEIKTAADAAKALEPFAGPFATTLFAVGIIGTGLLSIPVLAGSASYAVSESLGWKFGLYRKLKEAKAFYGVIIISMGVGILLNFVGIDPIRSLIYAAVGNALIAPVILFTIIKISSDHGVMGKFKNTIITTAVGYITFFIMLTAAVGVIFS